MITAAPTPHFYPMRPLASRNVAVIGAGAAGLVAARELRREGHKVVVFERESKIGGTWVYNPRADSDPLGVDPSRDVIHSSLYSSLRTNLPREVMGYRDYPFVVTNAVHRDSRRFPGHKEVLDYLSDFATAFGIGELVRFGTEVRHVGLVEDGKWKVRSGIGGDQVDEVYDAVVVCNGHYTEPRIAEIPGVDVWPGKQMHSHNYRVPEPFKDQIEIVHEDGSVVFKDGGAVCADVILHCTGYKYYFPFLDTSGIVGMEDNRVGPLYKHIFPPVLAPSLSFVGLPWKVVPFPMCEFQSRWIAGVLSGRLLLPSPEEMMADIEAFYSTLKASGIPKRYTHNMDGYQFEYNNWLAAECCCPGVEEWRKQMYSAVSKKRREQPETYRDEWDDHHLILQAHEDFVKHLPSKVLNGHLNYN